MRRGFERINTNPNICESSWNRMRVCGVLLGNATVRMDMHESCNQRWRSHIACRRLPEEEPIKTPRMTRHGANNPIALRALDDPYAECARNLNPCEYSTIARSLEGDPTYELAR